MLVRLERDHVGWKSDQELSILDAELLGGIYGAGLHDVDPSLLLALRADPRAGWFCAARHLQYTEIPAASIDDGAPATCLDTDGWHPESVTAVRQWASYMPGGRLGMVQFLHDTLPQLVLLLPPLDADEHQPGRPDGLDAATSLPSILSGLLQSKVSADSKTEWVYQQGAKLKDWIEAILDPGGGVVEPAPGDDDLVVALGLGVVAQWHPHPLKFLTKLVSHGADPRWDRLLSTILNALVQPDQELSSVPCLSARSGRLPRQMQGLLLCACDYLKDDLHDALIDYTGPGKKRSELRSLAQAVDLPVPFVFRYHDTFFEGYRTAIESVTAKIAGRRHWWPTSVAESLALNGVLHRARMLLEMCAQGDPGDDWAGLTPDAVAALRGWIFHNTEFLTLFLPEQATVGDSRRDATNVTAWQLRFENWFEPYPAG